FPYPPLFRSLRPLLLAGLVPPLQPLLVIRPAAWRAFRLVILRRTVRRQIQRNDRRLVRHAVNLPLEVRTAPQSQAYEHIQQPDAAFTAIRRLAAVVFPPDPLDRLAFHPLAVAHDADDQPGLQLNADMDRAGPASAFEPVHDAVLDERLQDHIRHLLAARFVRARQRIRQLVLEAAGLQREV